MHKSSFFPSDNRYHNRKKGITVKLHYAVHVCMLGAIVFLAAQLTNKNSQDLSVNVPEKDNDLKIQTVSSVKADSNEASAALQKEINLLKRSNEVADDKIKALSKEISQLQNENLNLTEKYENALKDDSQGKLKMPLSKLSEAMKMARMSPKKRLQTFYGPLFDKLNLSEEERQEFADLLMEQNGGNSKFIMINGVPLMSNKGQESDELKNFLGDDYETYKKYKDTAMERGQINTMNNNLDDTEKLSHDQQESLIDLLHERRQQKAQGATETDEDFINNNASFLSDKQRSAFKKQLKSPITTFSSNSITIR